MDLWAVPLLLAVGALLAVQAAANVQLSTAMRSPTGAATVQLAVGSGILLMATVVVGTTSAFGQLGQVTPWHLLGGLGSAIYITAGIVLFPRLGALVTVGLFITGQMLASLVLDTFGVLGIAAEPLRAVTVVGVIAVLLGATMIVRAQAGPARVAPSPVPLPVMASDPDRRRLGSLLLAVVGGAVLPVQGAVNAQLRTDLTAPLTVAAWSFLLATAAMALVVVVTLRVTGSPRPQLRSLRTVPFWGWLGGLVGAVYVTSVFLLIPRIGTASTIALTVAGQQLASVVVDHYGLLRLPRRRVPPARLAGVGVLLAGVALLQLA